MPEKIYSFNGKDITMNVCIQIRDVLKLLQEHFNISFEEAALRFYKSETYKTLQETCLLYTSPSPRDGLLSRMPSSA